MFYVHIVISQFSLVGRAVLDALGNDIQLLVLGSSNSVRVRCYILVYY
jgi:hypothetical protein